MSNYVVKTVMQYMVFCDGNSNVYDSRNTLLAIRIVGGDDI